MIELSPAMAARLAINREEIARDQVICTIADEIADALGKHTNRKHVEAATRAVSIIEARSSWGPDGALLFHHNTVLAERSSASGLIVS